MVSALTEPYTPPVSRALRTALQGGPPVRQEALLAIALGQAQAGFAGKGGAHSAYQQIPNKTTRDHGPAWINHSGAVINRTHPTCTYTDTQS